MFQQQHEKLQYNNQFLDKIIVAILTDTKFLLKCMDLQVYQYVDSQPHNWLIKFIIDFYKSYKVIPNMDSIKIKIQQRKEPLLKQSLVTTFLSVLESFDYQNIGFIKDKVINFCRFQQLKMALMKSIDLLKEQSYQQIYDLVNKTKFKGMESNLGIQYVSTYQDRHTYQTYTWIQTPWAVVNNALKGGLRSSKLGVVLAPSGNGKSWFLPACAAAALKQGKKVIYYTLEMTEYQIASRIDSQLTDKPIEYLDIPSNFEKMKAIIEPYRDNLRIKQFFPNKTKFEQLQNHFKQLILFENFEADLLVIDYADILKKEETKGNMYKAYGDVYTAIKSFCKQYKKTVWTGSQGNRLSFQTELVLGDGVSHSIGKIQIADFVISISRKHEDKLSNTARFVIVKNRGGKDGMVYNGIVDFEIGKIQMYDNYTQKSVQTRKSMDNNGILMKQKIRQRLASIQQQKQKER